MSEGTNRETTQVDVAASNRAADFIRASELRYRRLFESAKDGILILDADNGQIDDVNPFLVELTGFSHEDFLGKHLWEMGPFKDAAASKASFAELQANEYVRYDDLPLRTADGRRIAVEFVSNVYLVDDHKVIQCNIRDITARKQVEQGLAVSEMRYRRLFESAQDGILILNAETGKIDDVNPFLVELTGYSYQDFLDKHLWEIGPFKDIAASKDSFAELQANEYVRYEDLPLKTKGGQQIAVEFVSNVYLVDDHKVIQCNIRDITARKRAEEAQHESEGLFRVVFEKSAMGKVLTSCDGHILRVNDAFASMLGYRTDELEGRPFAEFTHPDDVASTLESRRILLAGAATQRFEKRYLRKDGGVVWADANIAAIRDTTGQTLYFVAGFFDISERKRMAAERQNLEEQLQAAQKLEAIGSLAGGVAHDFNNLLTVILSYTELAMEGVLDGDPLKDDLQAIKNAGDRAAVLTRQLLAFSRKQLLQPVLLDLNQVAVGVEKMLRRILGEDLDLVQTLAPDLGLTLADPGQIEQVLVNLVVNARDAMPEGGKLTIETSNVEIDAGYVARHVAVTPGSYVQLAVSDTGNGMDELTRARIFEPFFTTKEKGKGTGLGLSTVYGIVKQSGGNVWVYSELGQGTTFKVYLPRDLSGTAATALEPPTVPRLSTGTETILVVEDEEALRKVAQRTLGAAGYKVLTAADGDDALLKSTQHAGDIHLLLTDVVMPRMSGRVLAQNLLKARPAIKVLYMSGYTDDAIIHHGVLEAGTLFLAKPFTAAKLAQKVREVLDGGNTNPAYKYEPAAKHDAELETKKEKLDKTALRAVPEDVLSKLRRAVTAARYDEIVAIIESIRIREPELAAELGRMAGLFDYDGLRSLLGRQNEE